MIIGTLVTLFIPFIAAKAKYLKPQNKSRLSITKIKMKWIQVKCYTNQIIVIRLLFPTLLTTTFPNHSKMIFVTPFEL